MDSKRSFLDRLGAVQRRMTRMSEVCDVGGPGYIDALVDALRDNGFGCLVESFPPSRMPACTRCDDRFVAVCWMEMLDMRHGITARFTSRTTGYDRAEVRDAAYRGVFETAGMAGREDLVRFRCIDMGMSEYSPNLRLLTEDAPYVSI